MRFFGIKHTHSSQFNKKGLQTISRHGQRLTRLVLFWRHQRSAAPRPNEHRHEPLDELCIHRIEPPSPKGRCWVAGSILGHSFNALVFPEHALHPSYELGRSRISKLDIRREIDDELVVNFDRGWDIRPTTETAAAIVEILSSQLAKHIFPWFRFYAIGRRVRRLGRFFSRTNSGLGRI